MSDWWLPEDLSWSKVDDKVPTKALRHGNWLNADSTIAPSETSCIYCGEEEKDCTRISHSYCSISDCVTKKGKDWFYAYQFSDVDVPITDFYLLENNNLEEELDYVPLDCRACHSFASWRCIPLRNAIAMMDDSTLGQTEEEVRGEVKAIGLLPCENFSIARDVGFSDERAVFDWFSTWMTYYEISPFYNQEEMYDHVWSIDYWCYSDSQMDFVSTFIDEYSK